MSITIGATANAGAQATSASLDANKSKVKPGAKVKLRGQFPAQPVPQSAPAQKPDREVELQFKAAGKADWRRAKSTEADRDGRYAEKVKIRRSGSFRAVSADGRTSAVERVRVQAKLRSKLRNRHAEIGEKVSIAGKVKPTISTRKVVVRIGGEKLKTRTNRKGKFKVRWKADSIGTYKAKVKAKGNRIAAGNGDKAGRTTVYRPAQASYFGPGLYGNGTACGKTLTPSTKGVAHKSLPCGTKIRFRYKGKTATARVIDRGPYSGDREFDLTYATKKELGFGGVGVVWASY